MELNDRGTIVSTMDEVLEVYFKMKAIHIFNGIKYDSNTQNYCFNFTWHKAFEIYWANITVATTT